MKTRIEVETWRAVTAAGVVLPDELEAMFRRTERIDAELDGAQAEKVDVVEAPTAMIAGKSLNDAVADYRLAVTLRDDIEARRSTAAAAARLSRELTTKWIAANRNRLIVEHLRPVVAEILAEAVKLVPKLERFGPDYDGADVAATSTPALLTSWRDSRVLDERLRRCVAAWASSWNAATVLPNSGEMAPGYLRIEEPGGIHVWERPEAVEDVDVRYGRSVDVLQIAAWHEAGGYRLASIAEMVAFNERWQLEQPWVAGEFTARPVLVPTGNPVQGAAGPTDGQWAISV